MRVKVRTQAENLRLSVAIMPRHSWKKKLKDFRCDHVRHRCKIPVSVETGSTGTAWNGVKNMTRKVLAQKKVRIGGTDKGVEVVATRNKVGDYFYYRLAYYPATVKVDELSTGVQYEELVEFVANEFANGLRTL